jgi:hypothetical protein
MAFTKNVVHQAQRDRDLATKTALIAAKTPDFGEDLIVDARGSDDVVHDDSQDLVFFANVVFFLN